MKKHVYFCVLIGALISNSTFAQYQLLEKDGDESALYFNTKLDNVDGIIYTIMFENFSSPRKIKPSDIPLKDKEDRYSSEKIVLRLRCKDKAISMVDGQKFLNQNMQGSMIAFEKALSEKEVKWVLLETNYFSNEPYQSMLKACEY
jgi:hypothetical protein